MDCLAQIVLWQAWQVWIWLLQGGRQKGMQQQSQKPVRHIMAQKIQARVPFDSSTWVIPVVLQWGQVIWVGMGKTMG